MDSDALIRRFAAGDFSAEDERQVARLMSSGDHALRIEEALRREWESQPDSGRNLDHVLHRLHYLINMEKNGHKQRGRRVRRWVAELAAAAVVAVGLFFALERMFAPESVQTAFAELQAPLNARIQFTLPDGTLGWLNSGSTLRYPLTFNDNREVELFGEAFFDVEKLGDKVPFTVNANGGRVVVLGTRFNVNTDEKGHTAEVVLEEGKVEFLYDSPAGREAVTMEPGQKLVFDNMQATHVVDRVDPADYIQWIDGRFVIRGESVTSFMQQFARRFNMDVSIEDSRLDKVRFRATFENESPEEILRLLALITPISYTVTDRMLQPDGTFSKKRVTLKYSDRKFHQNGGIYQ